MYLFNLLAEEMYKGASNLFWGTFTFVLGMLVIFGGMAILVLVVSGVAKVMSSKSDKKTESNKAESTATEEVAVNDEDGISEEVRVAIMAAVLAYYEGEGVKNEFVVKKIKKLNY